MEIVVQKYGGTSVGDTTKIKNVARRIVRSHENGDRVVVVVSAMGGTTNRLLNLANEISTTPPEREIDMLLSTGEQVSIALLAMAVHQLGHEVISLTGTQVGLVTDGFYSNAKIRSINHNRILSELDRGKIVIVAGFQGITIDGEITTLGRGASDTTAVALAATLDADRCDIYTDVDGVFTADPRLVKNARKLEKISYDEMLEMARLGAKVLHSRSVELAKKFDVRLSVRSSFHEGEGTTIVRESEIMEQLVISGITLDRAQAKVTLTGLIDRPGIAAELFQELADKNINIDMIIQNAGRDNRADLSFTVSEKDLSLAEKVANEIGEKIGLRSIDVNGEIAKISAVGIGMKSHVGVAAKMFRALADEGINILMISTSEIKISCVIRESQSEHAMNVIHNRFDLGSS